jgi:hypothetical protein
MAMVCPNCGGNTGHSAQCPVCHIAASFIPTGSGQALQTRAVGAGWQHTPAGRVFIGLVLALGLGLALRHFLSAGLVSLPAVDDEDVSSILCNLLFRQGLEFLCLLLACIIAGSGQTRGLVVGAAIGLMSGLIQQGIARLQQLPVSEVEKYAGPLLSVFVGALGGLIGLLVWKPLPVVLLAPVAYKKKQRPSPIVSSFAGRIAWFRVLIGTAVVVFGALFPTTILNFVLAYSQGQLQISSPLQSTFVTWELIGLFVLVGSGIAGFGMPNGAKQGLCVGIASGLLIVAYRLSSFQFLLEELIFTSFVLLTLSLAGSWFACRLFPPVAQYRRRRITQAP